MKNFLLSTAILLFFSTSTFSQFEVEEKNENKLHFYPTINLLIGNPVQEFWANYSKQRLWGGNLDIVCAPFKKARFIEPGIQFEIYPSANLKDTWDGIEVETSSFFVRFNAMTRLRINRSSNLAPYLEFGYGLNLSSTTTSYEIVDKASFWGSLLGEEDEYEEVTLNDFEDYSQNFYAGVGLNLYRWITLQVKYNYSPLISYVQKDDIYVSDSEVKYDITKSKMQMVVISIGINFEKAFSD